MLKNGLKRSEIEITQLAFGYERSATVGEK